MEANKKEFKDLYEELNNIIDSAELGSGELKDTDGFTMEDMEDMSLIDHDYDKDIQEALQGYNNNDIRD